MELLLTASWDCSIKSYSCKDGVVDENTEDVFVDHENKITCLEKH